MTAAIAAAYTGKKICRAFEAMYPYMTEGFKLKFLSSSHDRSLITSFLAIVLPRRNGLPSQGLTHPRHSHLLPPLRCCFSFPSTTANKSLEYIQVRVHKSTPLLPITQVRHIDFHLHPFRERKPFPQRTHIRRRHVPITSTVWPRITSTAWPRRRADNTQGRKTGCAG
jgi:hypothetical protein